MKTPNLPVLAAMGLLFTGCVANGPGLVLAPVGPPPAPSTPSSTGSTTPADSSRGSLVVYSVFEVHPDFNATDPNRRRYTDYQIMDPQDQVVQRVNNNSSTLWEGPVEVPLPAGHYRIVARAMRFGRVTIPIVIVPRRLTQVHLGGGDSWPGVRPMKDVVLVRLPDGQAVGWPAGK